MKKYKLKDRKDLKQSTIDQMATCGELLEIIDTMQQSIGKLALKGFILDYMDRKNCTKNSIVLHLEKEAARLWIKYDEDIRGKEKK